LFRCEVSGFCHEEDENCALLGYYTMISGKFLPMSQDIGPIFGVQEDRYQGCPETSARNYHYSLCKNPEERSSQFGLMAA